MKVFVLLLMVSMAVYLTQLIDIWEEKYKRKQDKLKKDTYEE